MGAAVAERARACSARYGDYLSDIGTDQVVRDMDAIRAAVGDRKASFLGLSYGTRVGAVYAQTFPDRVRTMVLDGSLPPVSTATEISVGLATSFEGALNEYFARCVRERPACVFGDDPAAGFDALVNELRANPPEVPGTGGRRLTVGLVYQVILALIINFGGSTQAAESVIGDYLTTGDLTNIYAFTQIVAGGRQPDGTWLLVFQGFGHTAFTTSPCVASKAGHYLVTGRLPEVGTFCPNLPLAPIP